jgi:hypothetical protein
VSSPSFELSGLWSDDDTLRLADHFCTQTHKDRREEARDLYLHAHSHALGRDDVVKALLLAEVKLRTKPPGIEKVILDTEGISSVIQQTILAYIDEITIDGVFEEWDVDDTRHRLELQLTEMPPVSMAEETPYKSTYETYSVDIQKYYCQIKLFGLMTPASEPAGALFTHFCETAGRTYLDALESSIERTDGVSLTEPLEAPDAMDQLLNFGHHSGAFYTGSDEFSTDYEWDVNHCPYIPEDATFVVADGGCTDAVRTAYEFRDGSGTWPRSHEVDMGVLTERAQFADNRCVVPVNNANLD